MNTKYEQKKIKEGYQFVIGCDEVGRGSLAGPVVAAAVAFAPASLKLSAKGGSASGGKVIKLAGIKDSKLLSAKKREELAEVIKQNALAWSIGEVPPEMIDKINIHQATLLAMQKAVEGLIEFLDLSFPEFFTSGAPLQNKKYPESRLAGQSGMVKVYLYIDGKFTILNLHMKQEAVVRGDNKVLSVAAASIIAKVYRDELMESLGVLYPKFNFAKHKGYGTLHHRKMIKKHGLSPIHRKSFCKNLSV